MTYATVQTHTDDGGFITLAPEPWTQSASCATTDPELFFPEGKGSHSADARRICADCPVINECAEYAIRTRQRTGIWGGMPVPTLRRRVADARKVNG